MPSLAGQGLDIEVSLVGRPKLGPSLCHNADWTCALSNPSDACSEHDLAVVQDTSLNLLFAGHDTSASAIMLAVRHLKLQPEVLQKLRTEQQEVGNILLRPDSPVLKQQFCATFDTAAETSTAHAA